MKSTFVFAILTSTMLVGTSANAAQNFAITRVFTQEARSYPTPRESAVIQEIVCHRSGTKYFIYKFRRSSGPNFRVILPPNWANPIGGRDFNTYNEATATACS